MQYSGGLSEVQWGAIMQYSGGCKYGGGLSAVRSGGYHAVQWRVRSTVEGYHAVQWRVQVRWRAIMQYSGGCKYGGGLSCSTVEGYHIACGGLSCSTVEGASTVEGYLPVRWRAILREATDYFSFKWSGTQTLERGKRGDVTVPIGVNTHHTLNQYRAQRRVNRTKCTFFYNRFGLGHRTESFYSKEKFVILVLKES